MYSFFFWTILNYVQIEDVLVYSIEIFTIQLVNETKSTNDFVYFYLFILKYNELEFVDG